MDVATSVAAGNWTLASPMPTPRADFAVAASGQLLYAVGGTDFVCGTYATLEEYNATTNAWRSLRSMPTSRMGLGAAAVKGVIYAVGGIQGCGAQGLSVVEAYDPASDTWSEKAPMPTQRYGVGLAVVGGMLYAIGGSTGIGANNTVTTVEAYDPSTNHWTARASMPTAREEFALGVVGGRIFVAGGVNASATVPSSLDIYDPSTDSWSSGPAMLPGSAFSSGAALDGRFYVYGSVDEGRVLVFDVLADAWVDGPRLNVPRGDAAVAALDGSIYVLGGSANSRPVSTVETMRPVAENSPPVITGVEADPVNEGEATTVRAAVSDADGDALTATVDWGDNASRQSLPISCENIQAGCALEPLTHTYATNGTHAITITLSDAQHTSTQTVAAVVNNVPPTLGRPADTTLIIGETYGAAVSYFDPGLTDRLHTIVDYGDGSAPGIHDYTAGNADQSVLISHVYSSAGTLTLTLSMTDLDGATTTSGASVVVYSLGAAVQRLMEQVDEMVSAGTLARESGTPLDAKLDGAAHSITSGNTRAAAGQLGAFIDQVRALQRVRRITAANGDLLVAFANRIVARLD